MRKLAIIAALLFLAGTSFAMLDSLTSGVSQFCTGLMGILPVASMLMVIVGAVVYASGQIMGAETRARANVWATACLTGALIGIMIVSVAPPVLTAIGATAISCGGSQVPPPAGCGAGPACSAPTPHCCCAVCQASSNCGLCP